MSYKERLFSMSCYMVIYYNYIYSLNLWEINYNKIVIRLLYTFAVITSLYVIVLTLNKKYSTRHNLPNPTMCDTTANYKPQIVPLGLIL